MFKTFQMDCVVQIVIKTMNFMKSKELNYYIFRKLLKSIDAAYVKKGVYVRVKC